MTRKSPYDADEYRFNDIRDLPAAEFFTPASEIAAKSTFRARTIAQLAIADEVIHR